MARAVFKVLWVFVVSAFRSASSLHLDRVGKDAEVAVGLLKDEFKILDKLGKGK